MTLQDLLDQLRVIERDLSERGVRPSDVALINRSGDEARVVLAHGQPYAFYGHVDTEAVFIGVDD